MLKSGYLKKKKKRFKRIMKQKPLVDNVTLALDAIGKGSMK